MVAFAKSIEADKSFKTVLLKAIDAAQRDGTVGRIKANIMRNRAERPRWLEQVREEVAEECCLAGRMTLDEDGTYGAPDWNALLEFIKGLIPLIAELIKLFGV